MRYALRLAAGFGSQISMMLLRWVPTPDGQRPSLDALGYAGRIADPAAWQDWLAGVSGDADPHLEVDHRTLRVAARALAAAVTAPEPEPAPTITTAAAPAPAVPAAPAGPPVAVRLR